MRSHLRRRIRLAVGAVLTLAVLALAFPVSASPGAPNPGHAWTELENHGTSGTPVDTYYLGTTANQALELRVNNDRALRLEPNGWSPNVIGGYSGNSVTPEVAGATISGGGGAFDSSGNPVPNHVTDWVGTVGGGAGNQAGDDAGTTLDALGATVGGGANNTASGEAATVGGGQANTASGTQATVGGGSANTASGSQATVGGGGNNQAGGVGATVGGGVNNQASGDWQPTVGGGLNNTASGTQATVGGGSANTASGDYATVPGGESNTAQGLLSFAAGRRAEANNQGCFVWGDSTDADVACNDNNRFIARATGGVYLYTSPDLSTGASLAAGSGSWSSVSSRDVKENFKAAEGQEVLARLAEVPMSTWNYKAQDASIRHMGPMAQDFYAAFGLGESDTAITTVDADGVALAAIQGLYQLSQEQAGRIEALETQNASLQQRLDNLEARVSALEAGTGAGAPVSQASSSGLPAPWLFLGGGLALALGGVVVVQRRLTGARR